MNYPIAEQNLKLMKKVLDDLGVPFWLTCGTLLGYARENDFINHDTDIDLGIFIKDWNAAIISNVIEAGFELYHEFGTNDKGLEYSFIKDGVKVDLFFFYEDMDKGYHWMAVHGGKGMKSMCKYNFPWLVMFDEIEFKGEHFRIPSNYEPYLKAQYGPDWNVPMKHWHYFYSPFNREYENES